MIATINNNNQSLKSITPGTGEVASSYNVAQYF